MGSEPGSAEQVVAAIPLRRKFLYVAMLLATALLLGELAMRLRFWWVEDLPPTPDESLTYEWKWAQSHLAAGTPAQLADDFRFDPQLGWTLPENRKKARGSTNSIGLRGDREYPPGRQPGRHRLALLGDSFSYGAHVANDETFAHFLEHEELSGWEALNFAVAGYGTDQALLRYELLGGDLAADVVVMGFYVRDYERNALGFKVYAKPVFVPDGQGLRMTGQPVMNPEALYEEYSTGRRRVGRVRAPYLGLSLAKSLRRLRERSPSESDLEWQVLARLMRRFRDHVRAQGARPLWLVIPYRDVVAGGRSRWVAIEEMCEREARDLELPLLRLDAAFREHAARSPDLRLYRPRDVGGHLSVQGHRLVAASLASYLREAGWADRAPDDQADSARVR